MKLAHVTLLGLLAAGAWGCTSRAVDEPGADGQPVDEIAPEFPEGTGRQPGTGFGYAPGPYGVGLGSTIADIPFVGFGQPDISLRDEDATAIWFSHFYNPTGGEVYPEGSPLGEGEPKPSVLLVVAVNAWCDPGQFDAANILPQKHAEYAPMGGEFLLTLQEDPTGAPATLRDVQNWASNFDLDYPAVGDPAGRAYQYTGVKACPEEFVVRTRDMKIVRIRIGTVDCEVIGDPVSREDCFEVWETFEDVMAGNDIPGID